MMSNAKELLTDLLPDRLLREHFLNSLRLFKRLTDWTLTTTKIKILLKRKLIELKMLGIS